MSVLENTLSLLNEINKNVDLTHELQTEISPEVLFRRNSVNLLIGKKGSGKTYNVFREVLKLKFVPNHRYTKMLYVTNKPYDPTYSRIAKYLPIPVQKVPYDEAVQEINELSKAKSAICELTDIFNSGAGSVNDLADESKDLFKSVLGEDVSQTIESGGISHSIVLLDDCGFLFERRTRENAALWKLLFENRQPKITYFLTMQDAKGVDTAIKEAIDSVWLFGGFSQHKFNYLMKNIPHESDTFAIWRKYVEITKNQAIIFDNTEIGTTMAVLRE